MSQIRQISHATQIYQETTKNVLNDLAEVRAAREPTLRGTTGRESGRGSFYFPKDCSSQRNKLPFIMDKTELLIFILPRMSYCVRVLLRNKITPGPYYLHKHYTSV